MDENAKVNGRLKPGAGLIVQSILHSLNKPGSSDPLEAPDLVIGKPNPLAFDEIMKQLEGQDKSKVVMVGDKLETDIKFGQNAGID